MQVIAYFEIAPERGETPIDVRNRAERILKDSGLEPTQIGVVAEEPVKPEPKPSAMHSVRKRVYESPLYPGTDEVHEFYIERHLA